MTRPSLFLVGGARPNFMKVAPGYHALMRAGRFAVTLVHTGQHYDQALSDTFFREFDLPEPDIMLGVGSGTHGLQTARVLERFDQSLIEHAPDMVIVVGDVNSTAACALASAKMVYPDGRRPKLAHVEAGLRSFDRTMPEEINRLVTDALADYLFTSEPSGATNLLHEGVPKEKIFFVGNVMIDTLRVHVDRAVALKVWERFGLAPSSYGVVTLHRPVNVDDPAALAAMVDTLSQASERLPLVFPVHPRTLARLRAMDAGGMRWGNRIHMVEPLGYRDFLSIMSRARIVLTDSGGVQEETTALGIPCLTMRTSTERPVTVEQGTNQLVGPVRENVLAALDGIMAGATKAGAIPDLWDGHAAERIAAALSQQF